MLYDRSVIDTVSISDTVESFTTRGIEGVIEEVKGALNDRKYYIALSLACSYFQYLGKRLLGYDLNENKDLKPIIKELRRNKLVDTAICDDMDRVREARNDLQHNGFAFKFSSKQAAEYYDLAVKALKYLEYFRKKGFE